MPLLPKLLIYIVVGFIILMTVIWFFKEDIDLAVVPESKASTEVQVSATETPIRSESLTPAHDYIQGLLDDPNNFDTKKFEDMLPAQAIMHSKDMFLIGF